MFAKTLLWGSLIIPWLSLFFMKRKVIKRYMPVALFITAIVFIVFELAYTYKWWELNPSYSYPFFESNIYFALGPFLVGTIWIFHLTYKKFWVYLLTNVILDLLLAYPFNSIAERLDLYHLTRFSNWNLFLLTFALSLLIYGYQRWQDEVLLSPAEIEDKRRFKGDFSFKRVFHWREKAK